MCSGTLSPENDIERRIVCYEKSQVLCRESNEMTAQTARPNGKYPKTRGRFMLGSLTYSVGSTTNNPGGGLVSQGY